MIGGDDPFLSLERKRVTLIMTDGERILSETDPGVLAVILWRR